MRGAGDNQECVCTQGLELVYEREDKAMERAAWRCGEGWRGEGEDDETREAGAEGAGWQQRERMERRGGGRGLHKPEKGEQGQPDGAGRVGQKG